MGSSLERENRNVRLVGAVRVTLLHWWAKKKKTKKKEKKRKKTCSFEWLWALLTVLFIYLFIYFIFQL